MKSPRKYLVYPPEAFYAGMGAIVAREDWYKLTPGQAVEIAMATTDNLCHEGDIWNAFIKLCDERRSALNDIGELP